MLEGKTPGDANVPGDPPKPLGGGSHRFGTLITGHDVFYLSLYALDVIIIMLVLALGRFRNKEVC